MSKDEKRTLTPFLYEKLQKELEYLQGEGRLELNRSIESSREEGDLKENSGFDSLKEEQSKHEMRIQELEDTLKNSEVIDSKVKPVVVKAGFVVKALILDSSKEVNLYIGYRSVELATSKTNKNEVNLVCSQSSPAGKALIGKSVGDTITYKNPGNKEVKVKILDIYTYKS